jgi:hypothetical protein
MDQPTPDDFATAAPRDRAQGPRLRECAAAVLKKTGDHP